MSQLKKLAGQTAIYGVSSILGRVLNYALVPLHTTVFVEQEMGEVSYLYFFVALLLITYTFGMETTMFRFTTKNDGDRKYYQLSGTFVFILSTLFTVLIWFKAEGIANWMQLPHLTYAVRWLAIVLFIDATTSIPFAKLRLENKARQFAIAKMTVIILTVVLQALFLIVFPAIQEGKYLSSLQPLINKIYAGDLGIGYIVLANLLANSTLIVLLWKPILKFRFTFDSGSFKEMLKYAFPIFLTGLAGIASERIDHVMIRDWLPEGFYDSMSSSEALGVYSQTVKLSIFMLLAIQAFRYAGEPFFFSKAQQKDSPELFAKVMHYFVLLSLVIFVAVSINVDLIAQIFLRNPAYRVALYLVPILLLGKLLLGIYVNMSIWFKLTDRTIYGTYFSVVGAIVTIGLNLLLIPIIGYDGSAVAMLLGYAVMCGFCYVYGKKYYPIPYNFLPLLIHTVVASGIVWFALKIDITDAYLRHTINFGIVLVYITALYFLERRKLLAKTD